MITSRVRAFPSRCERRDAHPLSCRYQGWAQCNTAFLKGLASSAAGTRGVCTTASRQNISTVQETECPDGQLAHVPSNASDICPSQWSAMAKELQQLRQTVKEQYQMITRLQEHLSFDDGDSSDDGDPGPMMKRHFRRRRLTEEDHAVLPNRIILVRHAESRGNVEMGAYCDTPDHEMPLTLNGEQQARRLGDDLRFMLEKIHDGRNFRVFLMTSPYRRCTQTCQALAQSFTKRQVVGLRQAVQLREQDFGNFQDLERISRDLSERLKFGRFWYRFPNGESGADVYDRITIFEDHLARDMMAGRFQQANLIMVTHGLTLRIFLMRWFHWTVDDFLQVFNPPNAEPIVLEKMPWSTIAKLQETRYIHVKHVYYITQQSLKHLRGCTNSMASYAKRLTRLPYIDQSGSNSQLSLAPFILDTVEEPLDLDAACDESVLTCADTASSLLATKYANADFSLDTLISSDTPLRFTGN